MNVLILTEGGRDIGFGHITRCTSIYQAFEERGFSAEFIVNGDETIGHLVPDKRCRVLDWLTDRNQLFDIIRNKDIVFVDSYLADQDVYEEISNKPGTAVYFDDNLRIDYPKGFVLNGAVLAEQMPYPRKNNVTYLLGARYAPLRKEFWKVPAKRIRDNLEVIMVTFGGTEAHGLTSKTLKMLSETYPQLLKKVVVLKSFQQIEEIEQFKNPQVELIYHPNAAKMKEVMFEADIAVSAGGQTLNELARMGIPTIVVTVADNQVNSVRGWTSIGFVEYAGKWDNDEVVEIIRRNIQRLESKSLRQRKCKIGRETVDGLGCTRVVKEVLSNYDRSRFTLRQAAFSDAQDIFDLANDAEVRRRSFESNPIRWDDHIIWLREKLADSNCLFFILECQGEFAGQVRFDISLETKEAKISFSLHKHNRGLGLSSFVVSSSIEQLLKSCEEVRIIKAYIKQNNTASIKCFEKAGFRFLKNISIKGYPSKVYEKSTGQGECS